MPISATFDPREHRPGLKQLIAERTIEVEKRRASMARLPRKAAYGLAAYDHSAQARRHGRYLDSLLKRI